MTRNLDMARAAWGAELPDWVQALARECDATSQAVAGKRLEISGSTVNQVLRNRYPAGLDRVAATVRGRLMQATVECPVLGALLTDLCKEWQDKAAAPFHDTGGLRRKMRAACRACPRSKFARREVAA